MASGDPSDRSLFEWARWLLTTDHPTVTFFREAISTILLVMLLGLVLYAVSGVWPPMVAVESGSMEPHMSRGDLVFVLATDRRTPQLATGTTGVVTHRSAMSADRHRKFGEYGDVIVYRPDGSDRTPIIHRAYFWVNESEDWVSKADPRMIPDDDCVNVPNCPAPHGGFISKGDANSMYDQVSGISGPVKPEWVKGTAEVRIPWLGYIRLKWAEFQEGYLVNSARIDPVHDAA